MVSPALKVIITAVIKHSLGASGELLHSDNTQQKKAGVHSAIFKVSQQLRSSWLTFFFFFLSSLFLPFCSSSGTLCRC